MKIAAKYYSGQSIRSEQILKLVRSCYEINRKFFAKDLDYLALILIKTRKEMDRILGRATPSWLVGSVKNKKINIFTPEAFEQVSPHKKTEFKLVLTHEIAHLFLDKYYSFKNPVWLAEGLPGYIAGQYKIRSMNKTIKQKLSELHYSKDWKKTPNYTEAFWFTKFIIGKYGKQKLFALLAILREEENYSDFNKKFEKIFNENIDPVYNRWLVNV